jgi:hypothetical protein
MTRAVIRMVVLGGAGPRKGGKEARKPKLDGDPLRLVPGDASEGILVGAFDRGEAGDERIAIARFRPGMPNQRSGLLLAKL